MNQRHKQYHTFPSIDCANSWLTTREKKTLQQIKVTLQISNPSVLPSLWLLAPVVWHSCGQSPFFCNGHSLFHMISGPSSSSLRMSFPGSYPWHVWVPASESDVWHHPFLRLPLRPSPARRNISPSFPSFGWSNEMIMLGIWLDHTYIYIYMYMYICIYVYNIYIYI